MKQSIFILLLLQLFPFVVSCGTERETRDLIRLLRSFQETTIDLPDTLMFIKGQNSGFCQIDYSLPVMLYYYGPDECSNCAINQLADKMPMSKIADSLKNVSRYYSIFSKTRRCPSGSSACFRKAVRFSGLCGF